MTDLKHLLERDVPTRFRVPGGAAAVLKDGELLAKHTWGYANIDTREPVTSSTVYPICSISKQMVSLILTDLTRERGPQFEQAVHKAMLESLPASASANENLTIEQMIGMRSGLRDYWVMTVLWGATPQDRFSVYQDAPKALKRLGGFHFAPGTQTSYSNTNFLAVGSAIERVTGETLDDLLQARLFGPVGMKTAAMRADMARLPPPVVGYEGGEESGYIPYANRIEWAGDAGVSASLDDMIAYEKFIHQSALDEHSIYSCNANEPKYLDGKPASYGYGLFHEDLEGSKVVWHSGGLAGFRLRRAYVPEHRLSTIVLFNSETDTRPTSDYILKTIIAEPPTGQLDETSIKPAATKIEVDWAGTYFDDDAKIAIVVKQNKPGQVLLNYSGHDDKLPLQSETSAADNHAQAVYGNDSLTVTIPSANRKIVARSLKPVQVDADATHFLGKYYSEDVDSTFYVTGSGGMLYGSFDGYLGQGPAHVMRRLSEDVWWLACFRSLDASPPGYFTVTFGVKDGGKDIIGLTVSHSMARNVQYKKVDE